MFTCEVDTSHSEWIFNGTLRYNFPRGDLVLALSNYTAAGTVMELSIIARAEYNGAIVECFAASVFTDPIFYETKIAILNIQGTRKFEPFHSC